jgi:hypothetical protein
VAGALGQRGVVGDQRFVRHEARLRVVDHGLSAGRGAPPVDLGVPGGASGGVDAGGRIQ